MVIGAYFLNKFAMQKKWTNHYFLHNVCIYTLNSIPNVRMEHLSVVGMKLQKI